MLKWVKLYGTTAADGSLTVTAPTKSAGKITAVEWIDGDLADGVDAVLSVVRDDNAADYTILTLTDANVDKVYYPRELIDTVAGVEVAAEYHAKPIFNGQLKLVIASGGNAKSGGCIVYYED